MITNHKVNALLKPYSVHSSKPLEMASGKEDFLIIRDELTTTKLSEIVEEMFIKLKMSLTGNVLNERELPGIIKDQTIRSAISDADFIICVFDKNSDISPAFIDEVYMSHNMKIGQGIDGHIIPVFIDMTPEEADLIINHHSRLSFLKLYGAAYTQHDDWYERLIQSITTQPLGKKH